jgi:hypothetical protein
MRCLPEINLPTDRPFWIERHVFMGAVHLQNYLCREVQNVYPAYLEDWFGQPSHGGLPTFKLPPVYLEGGCIKFISGRHRTAVLVAHLEILPMALDTRTDHDEALFDSVRHSDLRLDGTIEIPDLPILTEAELTKLVDRSLPRIPTPDPC